MNTETTTGAKLDGIELRGIVQCDSQRELSKADLDDFVDAFIDFIEGRKQTYGGGFSLVDCDVVPEERQDRITQALVDALSRALASEPKHNVEEGEDYCGGCGNYRLSNGIIPHMTDFCWVVMATDALALVERTKEGGGE